MDRRTKLREQHAPDLLELVRPEIRRPLAGASLLDLGCGLGTNSLPAARVVKSVVGVDIDPTCVRRARESANREGLDNVEFRQGSALDLNESTFDIVLCDFVLEHVKDHERLVRVVANHLAPDGVYFLSTNNKWWPLEGHYGVPLPFVPFLPRPLADRIVRLLGLGSHYDIYPISLSGLTELLDRNALTWKLKPPLHPYTLAQKVGKRLVGLSPWFWNIANVFPIVGNRLGG